MKRKELVLFQNRIGEVESKKLSREEEDALILKAQQGDIEATHTLLYCKLKLIWKFSSRYYKYRKQSIEDLFSFGVLGFYKALEKHDVDLGYAFNNTLYFEVRNVINNNCRLFYGDFSTTLHYENVKRKVRKIAIKIEAKEGISVDYLIPKVTEECIAFYKKVKQSVSITDDVVKTILHEVYTFGEYDTHFPLNDMSAPTIYEPDVIFDLKYMKENINEIMKYLTDKQKEVILPYFGIGCTQKSQVEISKELGITSTATRSRVELGVQKLKKYAEELGLDEYI